MAHTLLLVDDDPHVLAALRRAQVGEWKPFKFMLDRRAKLDPERMATWVDRLAQRWKVS